MKRKYILYNCINKILNHFFSILFTGSEYINFGMWVRLKNLQHPLALNKMYEEAQILEMIEAKMLVAKFYKVLEFRIFFPWLPQDAREDFPKSICVKVNATQLAILHCYATPTSSISPSQFYIEYKLFNWWYYLCKNIKLTLSTRGECWDLVQRRHVPYSQASIIHLQIHLEIKKNKKYIIIVKLSKTFVKTLLIKRIIVIIFVVFIPLFQLFCLSIWIISNWTFYSISNE